MSNPTTPITKTTETLTARIDPAPAHERLWAMLSPASGLCSLCHGSGHLFCYQDGKPEFWDCPACAGAGVRMLFGAPTVQRKHSRGLS